MKKKMWRSVAGARCWSVCRLRPRLACWRSNGGHWGRGSERDRGKSQTHSRTCLPVKLAIKGSATLTTAHPPSRLSPPRRKGFWPSFFVFLYFVRCASCRPHLPARVFALLTNAAHDTDLNLVSSFHRAAETEPHPKHVPLVHAAGHCLKLVPAFGILPGTPVRPRRSAPCEPHTPSRHRQHRPQAP